MLNISPVFKTALLEFFDFDAERMWRVTKDDLKQFALQRSEISIPRNFLNQRNNMEPEDIYNETIKNGAEFITCEDDKYPNLLKQICDYPLLLYYKGDFERINFNSTLAIVGSRRASENAKTALLKIITQMKNLPITIVSGLAYGIDAAAHRGAIENNISTIGVIASGFNFMYPESNRDLYKKIEEKHGIIFSEYPSSTAPLPQNFPQRNRIVTGLSYGTLVAEAALKSGALISANLTLEQGRELMCLPGLISNPNTEGIYKLVKQGAPIITCAEDIFEILGWEFKTCEEKIKLTGEEKNVFDIISLESLSFEKIQMKIPDLDISKLMITLTGLELKGLVKQINGNYLKV
jgi:DNA processing protein